MTTLGATYCLDEQVGYLLRLAQQRHTAIFQTHMPDGLTAPQFATLARLHEHGACSQNALGRMASIDNATFKGVVDRLRHRGLLTTRQSARDKRRRIVSLTCEGQSLMTALLQAGDTITAQTLDPLTAREQHTFLRLLKKLA